MCSCCLDLSISSMSGKYQKFMFVIVIDDPDAGDPEEVNLGSVYSVYHTWVTPRMRRVLHSSCRIGSTYPLKIECEGHTFSERSYEA